MRRFFIRFLIGVAAVSVPLAAVSILIHHDHACEARQCGK